MSKEIFLYSDDKKYKCVVELSDSLDQFKCPDHSVLILFEERENGTYIIAQSRDKRLETEKDQQIANLEIKLAESEDRFQAHKQNDTQIIQEQTDLIDKLKQQLAEKDEQYQNAVANCVNLANTRAILKLNKVKSRIDDMKSRYDCDIEYHLGANNELTHLWEYIDNQIEELKRR